MSNATQHTVTAETSDVVSHLRPEDTVLYEPGDGEAADRPEQPADTEEAVAVAEPETATAPPQEEVSSAPAATPAPPSWTYTGPPPGTGKTPRNVMGRTRLGTPEIRDVRSAPTAALGPVGKRRAPIGVPILSAVTLGIYALVWHHRINTEMGDFDTRMHVRAGRSTAAVAIAWMAGLIVSVGGAARIVLDQLQIALPFDPHFTVTQGYFLLGGVLVIPYLVLLLSFSAVAMVMTLERVRAVEDRTGLTTDMQVHPAEAVWLLAVPVIGGLILQSTIQRRLNAVWEAAMPSPLARISQY